MVKWHYTGKTVEWGCDHMRKIYICSRKGSVHDSHLNYNVCIHLLVKLLEAYDQEMLSM